MNWKKNAIIFRFEILPFRSSESEHTREEKKKENDSMELIF